MEGWRSFDQAAGAPGVARFKTLTGPELRLKDRRQSSCEHNAQRECHAGLVLFNGQNTFTAFAHHADRESRPQSAPAEAPQRVFRARGDCDHLASGIFDHQVETRGNEGIEVNDKHAGTLQR
jgi:hypothetical protein